MAEKKASRKRIKIVFVPQFCGNATKFYSIADASAAAEVYSQQVRYGCEAFLCERCKVYHVRGKVRPASTCDNFELGLS